MNYCFFITDKGHLLSHYKKGTPKQIMEPIVFKVPMSLRFFTINGIEGPYFCLKHLQNDSKIFSKYKNINHITDEDKILTLTNTFKLKRDEKIKFDFVKLLLHVSIGTYDNKTNEVSGVHLISNNKINITKIIKLYKNGTFEAEFEILNPYTTTTVKKELSTFFPETWDNQKLFEELKFALKDVKKLESSKSKYLGFSSCGMPILFIIVNDSLKTAYPYIE